MALTDDINYQLRVAYIALLRDKITLSGEVIPVRNAFNTKGSKYILVTGTGATGVNAKDCTRTMTNVQFSIFCKGDDLTGNEADDIAAQLLSIVMPYPNFNVLRNQEFNVTTIEMVTDTPVYGSEGNTTTKILERNIIIEHTVTHHLRSR